MQCKYCGKELADGSAFCNFCGKPQKNTDQSASPAKSSIPPRPSSPEEGSLKCPHCGSTHLQFTTKVKTQGVSVGDACCGYVCLGPAGLLCGLCGAGSTESKDCSDRILVRRRRWSTRTNHGRTVVRTESGDTLRTDTLTAWGVAVLSRSEMKKSIKTVTFTA